jgi:hypothetical protein
VLVSFEPIAEADQLAAPGFPVLDVATVVAGAILQRLLLTLAFFDVSTYKRGVSR